MSKTFARATLWFRIASDSNLLNVSIFLESPEKCYMGERRNAITGCRKTRRIILTTSAQRQNRLLAADTMISVRSEELRID